MTAGPRYLIYKKSYRLSIAFLPYKDDFSKYPGKKICALITASDTCTNLSNF